MNIRVIDKAGLGEDLIMTVIQSLLKNRKPKEGSFDYGFETHGAIGINTIFAVNYPIQVYQSNKRKNNKSPIEITIERHKPF